VEVRDLQITGFRGVAGGFVKFGKFTVLVGQGNSGKTTIIEALALLLGKDRLVRPLTEHDFRGSTPAGTDRIKLIASIGGFEPNDPQRHPDWFRIGRGVEKWLCPSTGKIKPSKSAETDELVCQIAFAARFDPETLEVDTRRYFHDDDDTVDPFDEEAAPVAVPASLIKDIGFFLVPASRTWDRMISFGSELFRRVVAYVGGKPAEAVLKERDRLRAPEHPLEDDGRINELVGLINADLSNLFGRPSKLSLRLTTTDSDGVLDAVLPHFSEDQSVPLPSRRHGSGLVSLQTLVLLMRFGSLRIAKGESFLMCIEEPELHIPPPQQRKLIHLMQGLTTQTIVTTHSPSVAAIAPPHQLVLVSNTVGRLSANALLPAPLDVAATNTERGLFLSDRDDTVSAIMHRHVLVPEGKFDAIWCVLLSRICDVNSTADPVDFTHEVGVVPTRDAKVVDTFKLLSAVHPCVVCLVDGDAAGDEYIRALASLPSPPRAIIRWPDGWAIESVVSWLVEGDPQVLLDAQLTSVAIPGSIEDFKTALAADPLKRDEVRHRLIIDVVSGSEPCMRRARHVLQLLSNICVGRDVDPRFAVAQDVPNSKSKLWIVQHAVPGI